MGYILFNDKKKPVEAQAKKLNNNQVEITGCEVNTSGFSYYQDKKMKHKYGDFNDFKTLYRELDESYILSNNGSVYPEPSEPEKPEPTIREMVEELQGNMNNVEAGIEDTQIALCEFDEDIQTRVSELELAICELDMLINGGE